MIVAAIAAAVAAIFVFRDTIRDVSGVDVVAVTRDTANTIIGTMFGAYEGIVAAWGKLPAAFGDLAYQAAQKFLEVPYRGEQSLVPPTDPTLYRFHEAMMVFGPTMKEYIHEEFGDGIMSAIDFDLQMEREPNDAGDRVRITMSGKFLPYRYHQPEGNFPALGYKED